MLLSRHLSAKRQCWGHVCMYVVRSTRRNNVAKPKPHTLKLKFNESLHEADHSWSMRERARRKQEHS